MKSLFLFILLVAAIEPGCQIEASPVVPLVPSESSLSFMTSDAALQRTFDWAKGMALSYAHDSNDPVGAWYEAALPQREAFCMRDVSHQAVGAHLLGLAKHNRNMMFRFAENISEAKDWCSYWEINRYNRPAPADYTNDREFWYNLNANFDVVQACLKLYQWTGDTTYLNDPAFVNFYRKSMNEYAHHWQLEPDKIMNRPQYMHQPQPFDAKNNFHTCRGLGSYVENFRGLAVGVDLIATLYAGYRAYSTLAMLNGESAVARQATQTANQYRELLESRWWNPAKATYHTFWTADKTFHSGEGEPFILWFGATKQPERIRGIVKSILGKEWNVENLSAFPTLLYRLQYSKEAYDKLISLPHLNRAEYPEVSYGAIEGVVGGVMGIAAEASERRIHTLPQLPTNNDWAEVTNVPVFAGTISVRHTGNEASQLTNHTGGTVNWRASFKGKHPTLYINSRPYPASKSIDELGNIVSYLSIEVKEGETLSINTHPHGNLPVREAQPR